MTLEKQLRKTKSEIEARFRMMAFQIAYYSLYAVEKDRSLRFALSVVVQFEGRL